MAHCIDVRQAGNKLIILGGSICLPSNLDTSTIQLEGSIRFNPATRMMEINDAPTPGTPQWSGLATIANISGSYLSLNGGSINGNLTVQGQLFATTFTGVYEASGFGDISEYYVGDDIYEAGTVVILGGNEEVTLATKANQPEVAGIITTDPAITLNVPTNDAVLSPNQYHCRVAIRGRVPCKAIGPVSKGDRLTTSDVPGHAMKANAGTNPACIIGKAIQSLVANEVGLIEVMV